MKLGELRLPGVIESVGKLADFLREVAERLALPPKARHGLLLAADELATNIILHAYQEAGLTGEVEVSVEADDEFLSLTLADTGEPFDPRDRPEPASLGLPIEDREPGGLGIYLALRQVDECHYQRLDGRNINQLRIRRQSAPTSPAPGPTSPLS